METTEDLREQLRAASAHFEKADAHLDWTLAVLRHVRSIFGELQAAVPTKPVAEAIVMIDEVLAAK